MEERNAGLSQIVADVFAKMDADGSFRALLEREAKAAVENAVKEYFGSHGLRRAITSRLEVTDGMLDRLGLDSYSHMVMEAFAIGLADKAKADAQAVYEAVSAYSGYYAGDDTPRALSQLINEFVDDISDITDTTKEERNECHEGYFVSIKHDYTFNRITVDMDEYGDCAVPKISLTLMRSIVKESWFVVGVLINGREINLASVPSYMSRFESMLIWLCTRPVCIAIDEENLEKYMGSDAHQY